MQGGTLYSFTVLDAADISNIAAVIPITACPESAHASLADFVSLINRISRPEVRRFLSKIFDEHYADFCKAMGGWRYHHSYPGGLLAHSVSTATEAERQALRIYPNDQPRVDIIMARALLHDLGKAIQIYRGQNNVVLSALPHEQISVCLALEPLMELGEEWPAGGRLIAEILHELALPQSLRKKKHDAEIVHIADVLDVKIDRSTAPLLPLPNLATRGYLEAIG